MRVVCLAHTKLESMGVLYRIHLLAHQALNSLLSADFTFISFDAKYGKRATIPSRRNSLALVPRPSEVAPKSKNGPFLITALKYFATALSFFINSIVLSISSM